MLKQLSRRTISR